jgi:hypothetical protein
MKNYELPISPNYVHNWGIKEAIRELLQNAIDAEKCGFEKRIIYDKEHGILSIINYGTKLPMSSLVLGCSNKEDMDNMIGKFGEGYKLALVVLLRKGLTINITNGEEEWVPYFKISDTFNTQVLNIEVRHHGFDNNIVFAISGITEGMLNELLAYFPCIENDYGEVIHTANGDILLDKRFKGKMFVEGLYIQTDDNFKYGYNFNVQTVQLDRDRKAINYYDLRALTAGAMATADNCHPIIFKAISDSIIDVKDIKDVIDEASDEFLQQYRDMLYKDKNLEENTLVATEAVKMQLEQMNVDVPVAKGSEIESYLVAKANDKLGLLQEAIKEAKKIDNEEEAWRYFEDSTFAQRMMWLNKYKKRLSKKAIDEFMSIVAPSYNFHLINIYIPDDFDYTKESIKALRQSIKEQREKDIEKDDE